MTFVTVLLVSSAAAISAMLGRFPMRLRRVLGSTLTHCVNLKEDTHRKILDTLRSDCYARGTELVEKGIRLVETFSDAK